MTARPFHRPPLRPWQPPSPPEPLPASPSAVDSYGDSDTAGRVTALLPGIVTAGLFGLVTGNMTFAVVSVVAALVTFAVWKIDASRRRRRRARERGRRDSEHAKLVAAHAEQWQRHHVAVARRRCYEHPDLHELPTLVAAGDERLWHWRPGRHDDVWHVALGRGSESVKVAGTDGHVIVDEVPRVIHLAAGVVVGVHGTKAVDAVRAMIMRLAVRSGPADWRLRSWPRPIGRTIGMAGLAHSQDSIARTPHSVVIVDEPARWVEYLKSRGDECVIVMSRDRHELPAECDMVIDSDGVDVLDASTADAVVRTLNRWSDPEVPESAALVVSTSPIDRSPYAALLGHDGIGREMWLDIVRDGPHAVVVGCTGSGKSEFLLRWITRMCSVVDSRMLNVLVVDYKGGSTGDVLARLPHTVGVLTDLDDHMVRRAAAALRHEFRDREETLRSVGARRIDDCDPGVIPRLVVVVDEVAALRSRSPEFLNELLDIAHRGRSLGIHLVMATQRPRALTADVIANSDIRVALRVLTTSDSVDVVGSPIAAAFPRHRPGRAAITCSGSEPSIVDTLLADTFDVVGDVARRLWCAPLPVPLVPRTDSEVVAVLDDIDQRCQPEFRLSRAWWTLIGEPRARSVALATLIERLDAVVLSASDCDAETIHRMASTVESPSQRAVVIDGIDDIQAHRMNDAASRLAWSRLERSLSDGNVEVLIATSARESAVPTVIRDRCERTFCIVDSDGGFEIDADGRPLFGRFVAPSKPWRVVSSPRLPTRIERDDCFAVFADDERAVSLPTAEPWRLMVIGEPGSGRTTALRALAAQWHRERGHLSRRLVTIDDGEKADLNVNDESLDLIVAVDPLALRHEFDHWAQPLRRWRSGLLLGRSAVDHADVLGANVSPSPYAIVPGRGEWVLRGIAMGTVQVTF